MSEPAVRYERMDQIGLITLDQPARRNSMSAELLAAFAEASARAAADPDARCVVITGTGSCFSAGADLKQGFSGEVVEPVEPAERTYQLYRPFLSVLEIEVPVIAALNGHAVGGGFGLSLVCDLRVANETAKYGANFARLGLSAGMAISYLLPRLVGPTLAAELMFTGRLFRGAEALQMGLVNRAVPADRVLPEAMAMAEAIAGNAPIAIREIKKVYRAGLGWDVQAAARREAVAQARTMETSDCIEGLSAMLQKRKPVFRGR